LDLLIGLLTDLLHTDGKLTPDKLIGNVRTICLFEVHFVEVMDGSGKRRAFCLCGCCIEGSENGTCVSGYLYFTVFSSGIFGIERTAG
jgi:hypothetical protein